MSWLQRFVLPSVDRDAPPEMNLHDARDTALQRRLVRGGYDAAKTTPANTQYWAQTDSLSASQSNTLPVRKVVRDRARYECANSAYAYAIVRALANDIVGTGPRIHVETENEIWNTFIESELRWWLQSIGFARKLRTGRLAQAREGEGFLVQVNNPNLHTPVKLDLRSVECDHFSDPEFAAIPNVLNIDGKIVDKNGNPVSYRIMNIHPGTLRFASPGRFVDVPASEVFHMFREDRAGQQRGVSEIMSALGPISQLRRLTLATLDASEAAADFALVIESNATPEETEQVRPMDTVPLDRGIATVLPRGHKLGQVKAEQPNAEYSKFKTEIIAESARSVLMPYLIAAGDARGHTFSGGRLDKQSYDDARRINRQELTTDVVAPLAQSWWDEAILVSNYMPVGARTIGRLPITAYWDQSSPVDELKSDKAALVRLQSFRSTIPREMAERGLDWREEFKRGAEAIGVSFEEYQKLAQRVFTGPWPEVVVGDEESDEPTGAGAR